MDVETTKQFVTQLQEANATKDKVIEDLKNQIDMLSTQLAQQNKTVSELNTNIANLTEQIGKIHQVNIGNGLKRPHSAGFDSLGDSNQKIGRTIAPSSKIQKTIPAAFGAANSTNTSNSTESDETIKMNTDENHESTNSFARVLKKNTGSRPTPIQLGKYDKTNNTNIIALLSAEFEEDEFEWIQFRPSSPSKLYAKNADVKKRLIEFLNNNGIEFNSYAEKMTSKSLFCYAA